jgi:hypothetical protein
MKKIILSIIIYCLVISPLYAGDILDSAIKYWYSEKKLIFCSNKHLENIDFKTIYSKPIYQKSYFGYTITGVVIVGAGAFTYFTAGAGAPVAATGTSTVAAWVAGGGAGSYMAGLSTIGGWFGGNAILGASILNGISVGVIGGGTTTFATMSILSKVGVMTSITASGLDGVFYFSNDQTNQLEYKVKITIPKDLGSKSTRTLVDNLYEVDKKIVDAYKEKNESELIALFQKKEKYYNEANSSLKKHLSKSDNQEDLLILGIIAWNNNHIDLFNNAMSKIDIGKLDNTGFINYLYALKALSKENLDAVFEFLGRSMTRNPYAIEPILLYINVLGNQDFVKNESKIISLAEKAEKYFDSDNYSTVYSLVSVYYRIATFYFINKQYDYAQMYFDKAYDELSVFQKYLFSKQLGRSIRLSIANSVYRQGNTATANALYDSVIDDVESEEERNATANQYLGYTK